jgi:hypothetical protein
LFAFLPATCLPTVLLQVILPVDPIAFGATTAAAPVVVYWCPSVFFYHPP